MKKFLESSLGLLSADVFYHPIWQHAQLTNPIEAEWLAGALQHEVTQLAAQENWLDACRVSLACAFMQNLAGKPQIALQYLRSADQMARNSDLAAVVIWIGWGASAICMQNGDYHQAGGYLLRLQQDLYNQNQWVLADVIDLVRQSLMEWNSTGRRPTVDGADRAGQLMEQMLCWGRPPEDGPDNTTVSEPLFAASGWQHFWRTLLRLLHGELRLGLIEVDGHNHSPASDAPKIQGPPVPLYLPPPVPAAYQDGAVIPQPPAVMISDHSSPEPPMDLEPNRDFKTGQMLDEPQTPAGEPGVLITGSLPVGPARQTEAPGRQGRKRSRASPMEPARPLMLKACLLGSFRVELDGAIIDTWPSGRSKAVFAYLLAHHMYPVSREVLMETFWPEATIDSARNSLNVAVYNLRQELKNLTNSPVILLHESTAYQVNPDLQLWLDITEFEQTAHKGRQHESAGTVDVARRLYQAAIDLYQGDFLADTPFEGWTTMERERMRVLYLETLDHLSMIYFNQNQYDDCIDLCQRILSHDACREDAHCRLMRCYARQGQAHLAMRQFQACVDALRDELDVPPSPTIVLLCEQIKRQEAV